MTSEKTLGNGEQSNLDPEANRNTLFESHGRLLAVVNFVLLRTTNFLVLSLNVMAIQLQDDDKLQDRALEDMNEMTIQLRFELIPLPLSKSYEMVSLLSPLTTA